MGTALLVAAVVGSGVMAEQLSGRNSPLALLTTSLAAGCALVTRIFTFAPISGALLNSIVTLVSTFKRALQWRTVPIYVARTGLRRVIGAGLAHVMFDLPIIQFSQHFPPTCRHSSLRNASVLLRRWFSSDGCCVSIEGKTPL